MRAGDVMDQNSDKLQGRDNALETEAASSPIAKTEKSRAAEEARIGALVKEAVS
jgi:hypothetical protein